MYRRLPLQQQKILDTDRSAPESPENVKIYKVTGSASSEMWLDVSYDIFVVFYYVFTL